ncbi:MAG: hypothetical protein PHS37_07710 [Candidatus Omnitrophica bacterium]|nr:hypothetical protein [Candidatus Omnitrophota bacterium]
MMAQPLTKTAIAEKLVAIVENTLLAVEVRCAAIRVLRGVGENNERAVRCLADLVVRFDTSLAKSGDDALCVKEALIALGSIAGDRKTAGGPTQINLARAAAIIQAEKNGETSLREEALDSFINMCRRSPMKPVSSGENTVLGSLLSIIRNERTPPPVSLKALQAVSLVVRSNDNGYSDAKEALLAIIEKSIYKDPAVKIAAIKSYGKIIKGDTAAGTTLAVFIEDKTKNLEYRIVAAQSLGISSESGKVKAKDFLKAVLNGQKGEVTVERKIDACLALGTIDPGNETAVKVLVDIVNAIPTETKDRQDALAALKAVGVGNQAAIDGVCTYLSNIPFSVWNEPLQPYQPILDVLTVIGKGNAKARETLKDLIPKCEGPAVIEVAVALDAINPGPGKDASAAKILSTKANATLQSQGEILTLAEVLARMDPGNATSPVLCMRYVEPGPEKEIRLRALRLITKPLDDNFITILVNVINKSNEDMDIRLEALKAYFRVDEGNAPDADQNVSFAKGPGIVAVRRVYPDIEAMTKGLIDRVYDDVMVEKQDADAKKKIDDTTRVFESAVRDENLQKPVSDILKRMFLAVKEKITTITQETDDLKLSSESYEYYWLLAVKLADVIMRVEPDNQEAPEFLNGVAFNADLNLGYIESDKKLAKQNSIRSLAIASLGRAGTMLENAVLPEQSTGDKQDITIVSRKVLTVKVKVPVITVDNVIKALIKATEGMRVGGATSRKKFSLTEYLGTELNTVKIEEWIKNALSDGSGKKGGMIEKADEKKIELNFSLIPGGGIEVRFGPEYLNSGVRTFTDYELEYRIVQIVPDQSTGDLFDEPKGGGDKEDPTDLTTVAVDTLTKDNVLEALFRGGVRISGEGEKPGQTGAGFFRLSDYAGEYNAHGSRYYFDKQVREALASIGSAVEQKYIYQWGGTIPAPVRHLTITAVREDQDTIRFTFSDETIYPVSGDGGIQGPSETKRLTKHVVRVRAKNSGEPKDYNARIENDKVILDSVGELTYNSFANALNQAVVKLKFENYPRKALSVFQGGKNVVDFDLMFEELVRNGTVSNKVFESPRDRGTYLYLTINGRIERVGQGGTVTLTLTDGKYGPGDDLEWYEAPVQPKRIEIPFSSISPEFVPRGAADTSAADSGLETAGDEGTQGLLPVNVPEAILKEIIEKMKGRTVRWGTDTYDFSPGEFFEPGNSFLADNRQRILAAIRDALADGDNEPSIYIEQDRFRIRLIFKKKDNNLRVEYRSLWRKSSPGPNAVMNNIEPSVMPDGCTIALNEPAGPKPSGGGSSGGKGLPGKPNLVMQARPKGIEAADVLTAALDDVAGIPGNLFRGGWARGHNYIPSNSGAVAREGRNLEDVNPAMAEALQALGQKCDDLKPVKPQSLILYADDILKNAILYDFKDTLKLMKEKGILKDGKIVLYVKNQGIEQKVEELKALIERNLGSDTEVILVKRWERWTNDQLAALNDPVKEVESLVKITRANEGKDILAVIRGNGIDWAETFKNYDLKVPLVIINDNVRGIFSFSEALLRAMAAKLSVEGASRDAWKQWVICLNPIEILTDKMAEQYNRYRDELLTKA